MTLLTYRTHCATCGRAIQPLTPSDDENPGDTVHARRIDGVFRWLCEPCTAEYDKA